MKFQGLLFIDVDVRVRVRVRVRVQFEHILCLVVHSFRGNLLTQPDSMILSFAYMVAAEQLKKIKIKTCQINTFTWLLSLHGKQMGPT